MVSADSFEELSEKARNRRPIRSVDEFVSYIGYLQEHWDERLWYRGVSSARYKLTPSIYRGRLAYRSSAADDEEFVFMEFIRRAKLRTAVGHPSYSRWEWYQTMQHYGVPTRLLDWTEGALIGLYFALRHLDSVATASVWVLDPHWLNKQSTGHDRLFCADRPAEKAEFASIVDSYVDDFLNLPALPIAVLPPHSDERVVVQRSVFTIHGSDRKGLHTVFRKARRPKIVQLQIDNDYADLIKGSVAALGVTESTVFPELEGIARDLKEEFRLY